MNRSTVPSMLADALGGVTRIASRLLTVAVAGLGVTGLLLSVGCYAYEVKAPADLTAGEQVDVTVNNMGRVALAPDVGEDVASVDGDVVALTDSVLRVRVVNVKYINGTSSPYPGSVLDVPRTTITHVSTTRFSPTKTTVVAVGLAAALIAAITSVGIAGSGGSSPDPKPGTGGGVQ